MARLISQLLDFTRARLGGGFELQRKRMSLLAAAKEVADETVPALSRRTLRVEGDDVHGEWDRDRIAQVLANLVTNAVKHSPDGSRIRVDVRSAEADVAAVDVWNEGPPMPPGTKVFEPFERGTKAGDGLGLGLYIAHEIVRAHGGSLTVDSNETGTTFRVRLPMSGARADRLSVRPRVCGTTARLTR
jgi:signal transduction histidine kinase